MPQSQNRQDDKEHRIVKNSAIEKCLIIGPSWVGDMVMAQSLFSVLKQQNSKRLIDVMAPPWSQALLDRMPEVSDVIDMPLGHGQLQLKQRYRLAQTLKNHQYQQVIVLPNSLKSALIPFWSKIPKRTGYVGEMRYGLLNDIRPLNKSLLTMTVQRFVALAYTREKMLEKEYIELKSIPTPRLFVEQESVQSALAQFQLSQNKKILALCPGAEYGPAKQWPAQHYGAIAKEKLSQGWQVWIFGSEKDRAMGEQINDHIDQYAMNLCGQTELAQAIDLMSLSQMVVSNDSGLMHMAAALNVPVVGLYGSSDANFTPPLGDKTATISLNLDCSPCFKRKCPYEHTHCLQHLTPDMVSGKIEQLLDAQSC